ncbi:MAG: hypothetical protein ACRC28_07075 [Clostridium sp.]|uniref:hypothetical protein n=1 Tax=Clostridium sp. TaxID=1506 RepID=UPI003F30DF88
MPNLELYSTRDNIVQLQAGLNWGFSVDHTCLADAYIALTSNFFRLHPNFFLLKEVQLLMNGMMIPL